MDIFTIKQWLFLLIIALLVLAIICWKIYQNTETLKSDNAHIYKLLKDGKGKP